MKTTSPDSPPIKNPAGFKFSGPLAGRFLALGVLWAHLIYQVHYQWGGASYYNYGWIVPILALLLFYNRFEFNFIAPSDNQAFPKPNPWRNAVVLLIAFGLIPVKILSEVNVFWRVPLFFHAGGVLAITLIWLYEWLGKENFKRILFPLFFTLTMLPWPYRIESQVIQGFSNQVTHFTAFVLNGLGMEAQVAGNTIRMGELTVGVDDACSGIRSLQSLLMVALFLGDYFFLTIGRRFALIGLGILLVFVFNSLRSTLLSVIYFLVGEELYDFLHDPVGLVTFGLSFLFLFLTTLFLRSKRLQEGLKRIPISELRSRWIHSAFPNYASGIHWISIAVLTVVLVEGWFILRSSQSDHQQALIWSLQPTPEAFTTFEELPIPDRVADTLAYDYGLRVQGVRPDLIRVEAYYYGYTGENRMNSVSSYGHSPLICMSAVGAELDRIEEPFRFEKNNLSLPLQHYVFAFPEMNTDGRLHVFWAVAERNNQGFDSERLQSLDYLAQLQLAFLGRRDYARKVVLISISGTNNPQRVTTALQEILDQWIQSPIDP